MDRLRQKLQSETGASILPALLFLLVCMMVSASILMAADSNAGKFLSNRREHQNYLTVSSALQMTCDSLTSASYKGRYTYQCEEVMRQELQEDGTTKEVVDHYLHIFTQESGTFTCSLNISADNLTNILPFNKDLDAVFSTYFKVLHESPQDEYEYRKLGGSFNGSYELTFTVNPDGVNADETQYKGISQPVTVEAVLQTSGIIRLTAWLGEKDEPAYVMEAELVPNSPPGKILVPEVGGSMTKELTWTLSWIAKKEAEVV